VKLPRQMAALLLLCVDEPRSECRSLTRRPVEACREGVEDRADALKLDEPEVRQAARQVAVGQPIVGRRARPIATNCSTQMAITTIAVRPSSPETSFQIAATTAAGSVVTRRAPEDFP